MQGSSFPPICGGEVGFAKKLPPHGGDPGGEVFPPMGERLGGKLRKLPPHNGGEAEKILRSQLRRALIFLLKIHFLKEMQLQNPQNFRLRRAVSWEQNYIDFAYCPPQARKILG